MNLFGRLGDMYSLVLLNQAFTCFGAASTTIWFMLFAWRCIVLFFSLFVVKNSRSVPNLLNCRFPNTFSVVSSNLSFIIKSGQNKICASNKKKLRALIIIFLDQIKG